MKTVPVSLIRIEVFSLPWSDLKVLGVTIPNPPQSVLLHFFMLNRKGFVSVVPGGGGGRGRQALVLMNYRQKYHSSSWNDSSLIVLSHTCCTLQRAAEKGANHVNLAKYKSTCSAPMSLAIWRRIQEVKKVGLHVGISSISGPVACHKILDFPPDALG